MNTYGIGENDKVIQNIENKQEKLLLFYNESWELTGLPALRHLVAHKQ